MKEILNHFINKPCTITTLQINYRFKEEHMFDYFMGVVENIDEDGVLISHVVTKNKSYIFFPHIVSISEEQVLYDSNPEHAKIIEDYRKQKPITAEKTQITPPGQPKFVNPLALKEMAKKAKEAFDK